MQFRSLLNGCCKAHVARNWTVNEYISRSHSGRQESALHLFHDLLRDTMIQALKLILVSMAVALTGCAANVTRHTTPAERLPLSPVATKRIAVDVQGSKAMAASDDWDKFRAEWQVGMAEAATAAGMKYVPLEAALSPHAAPTTLVTLKINDYRYVTQVVRVAVGIITGDAYINTDVAFAELPGPKPVGTRNYATTSSMMQGVFSPMTENQIRGISNEIVKEIAMR
ncbi:hypothetical protein QTI66_22195 [Variovorax sp. J22R133]|uniref:hypothetical protein n=1 Tax=Variovorax brevis TaxID=3053503 RepID=UPI0025783F09|nr:hypothetical protein [Variovorax sp. J22R133]MDM0114877.1 hypothetical protein [Variovorax sp. J22R133]